MSIWKLFKLEDQATKGLKVKGASSELAKSIMDDFPQLAPEDLARIASIAGLFAQVAHTDLHIDQKELDTIQAMLVKWVNLSPKDSQHIASLAAKHQAELAGQENHLYGQYLVEVLNQDERYQLLVALFATAASDGTVSNLEAEEIRIITKGLNLEHKHYVSAKAEVSDYLGSLRENV